MDASTRTNADEIIFPTDDRVSSAPTSASASACHSTFCENVTNYPTQMVNAAIARNASLRFLESVDELLSDPVNNLIIKCVRVRVKSVKREDRETDIISIFDIWGMRKKLRNISPIRSRDEPVLRTIYCTCLDSNCFRVSPTSRFESIMKLYLVLIF